MKYDDKSAQQTLEPQACMVLDKIWINEKKSYLEWFWLLDFPSIYILVLYICSITVSHQGLKEFFLSDFCEKLFLTTPGVQIRWNFYNIYCKLLTKIWQFFTLHFLTVYSYFKKKKLQFFNIFVFGWHGCPQPFSLNLLPLFVL